MIEKAQKLDARILKLVNKIILIKNMITYLVKM